MAYYYNPSFFFLLFVTLFLTSDYVIQSDARHLLEITLPELPKPELPHLPEIPTLPKLEFPEIPKAELPTLPKPELPKISKPELPTLPKPELPALPKLEIPFIPMPELPTLPKLEIPQKVKTSCKKNNCKTVWDDELTLALKYPNVQIVLTVYDKDTFSKDDKIGEAKIDIKPYLKALEMSYHQDLPDGVKMWNVVK
uniref:Gamma-gliadin n=1 Tax=Solanum tuberosum TaxID=4113 RepID=M1C4M8_SOLTU